MIQFYESILRNPVPVPGHWKEPCASKECSLHQLSPYIGKLKSSIAHDLVATYSQPEDLIVDPFAGSGTIPLESVLQNRGAFAGDISPYAKILCRAKLSPPPSLECALEKAEEVLDKAHNVPDPDLGKVPAWVRQFFHPQTLKEAIKFTTLCRRNCEDFLFASFLGILHHQRPGFLSYPSSHLVPYLRNKKYPSAQFPEMYDYRELRPRLLAKIRRAYAQCPAPPTKGNSIFRQCSVEDLNLPNSFDCLITSPPYMNALDYNRDNRLRLWFIDPKHSSIVAYKMTRQKGAFERAMAALAKKINKSLKSKGYSLFIVGERVASSPNIHLSRLVCNIMKECAPKLKLLMVMEDDIPDVRRSRRYCRGTKRDHFLLFQRR